MEREVKKIILNSFVSVFIIIVICTDIINAHLQIRANKNPIISNFRLHYNEETFINGSNCPDEYLLGVYDMAIDSMENLYFVTWSKVLKFNKKGKFQRMFCNIKGEGPGELQQEPFRLYIDQKDNLYITDGNKIVQFNSEGKFIKNIKVFGVGDFILSSKKYIFCVKSTYRGDRKKNRYITLKQFNFKGKKVNEFLSYPNQTIIKIRRVIMGCKHYYTPYIYFCATDSGGLCFGYNEDYSIYIANSEGKVIKTIKVDLLKDEVKSNEINAIKDTLLFKVNNKNYYKLIPIPKFKPYFNRILCDEKNRIYVVRIQSVLTRKKYEVVDIFSTKGQLLYRVNMPYVPRIIRNGVIYTVDKSDKEDIKIKKLIIKNYKAMKY